MQCSWMQWMIYKQQLMQVGCDSTVPDVGYLYKEWKICIGVRYGG